MIILVLLVGGGIYLWQQSVLKKVENANEQQKNELQQQIDNLQTQLNQAIADKNVLQQQIEELTKEPERYVKVISPNGGDTLCLDENFVIKWDSKEVNTISLYVLRLEGGGTTRYPLGTFPATLSETGEAGKGDFVWTIGNTSGGIRLEEGYSYKIEIMSADGTLISDTSNSVFEILLCKG